MVSTRPLISKSSIPSTNPLVTVPRAPITIGITIIFKFHSFFSSLAWSRFFIVLFTFLQFYSLIRWDSKVHHSAGSLSFFFFFFFLTINRSDRLVRISKSQRILCFSFPKTDFGLCKYHLFIWSNFSFLHNSQWITLPTQSCLVLYSLSALIYIISLLSD